MGHATRGNGVLPPVRDRPNRARPPENRGSPLGSPASHQGSLANRQGNPANRQGSLTNRQGSLANRQGSQSNHQGTLSGGLRFGWTLGTTPLPLRTRAEAAGASEAADTAGAATATVVGVTTIGEETRMDGHPSHGPGRAERAVTLCSSLTVEGRGKRNGAATAPVSFPPSFRHHASISKYPVHYTSK